MSRSSPPSRSPHKPSPDPSGSASKRLAPIPRPRSGEDSAWKDILERNFRSFLEFFFPWIAEDVDWSYRPQFLDKELEKIFPRDERGRSIVDKLVRVRRKGGGKALVCVHVEVEGRSRRGFAERMSQCNFRISGRYACLGRRGGPVASLGVFTGRGKAPEARFEAEIWGTRSLFEFPVVDLKGYEGRGEELEREGNPFAAVVLAHLERNEARGVEDLKVTKLRLIRKLYERRRPRRYIIDLLRFIDWLLVLPRELEEEVEREAEEYEGRTSVPYVTSWERMGMERGLIEAIGSGLELRFGREGKRLLPRLKQVTSLPKLRRIRDAIFTAESVEEIRRLLPRR